MSFSVRTVSTEFEEQRRQNRLAWLTRFPATKVLVSGIPSKVCFFVWSLWKGSILTQDNLQRRGFLREVETVQHLFLQCRVARELWRMLMFAELPDNLEAVIAAQQIKSTALGRFLEKRLGHIFLWAVWIKRNQRIFKGQARSVTQLADFMKLY